MSGCANSGDNMCCDIDIRIRHKTPAQLNVPALGIFHNLRFQGKHENIHLKRIIESTRPLLGTTHLSLTCFLQFEIKELTGAN